MTEKVNTSDVKDFLEALGLDEEPMGMHYTDVAPKEGITPKSELLPTIEMEARGEVDWGALFGNFSCVVGNIWRARKKKTTAYFDKERFGCLGGAFYLGFLKPQLNFITYYVSTGIPDQVEGERYLESPEVTRNFFDSIDPPAAPARYCVFRPITQFLQKTQPILVTFFCQSRGNLRSQSAGHLCHQ